MAINRRSALALIGLGGAAGAAGQAQATKYRSLFDHGVASGDPLTDRVIIWTRTAWGGDEPLPLTWEVFADAALKKRVASGRVLSEKARDWTVKVDVTGLTAGRDYWYRFSHQASRANIVSPTGRTRTLPAGRTKDVVMAVASCALYPGGYFNAYEAIANLKRVDVVVHLGDYIYEYGATGYGHEVGEKIGRLPVPANECVTLADYRARHACHKADFQLQQAHARAPWIVVWDDHETANDSFRDGAENHDPDKGEGDWNARKAAAIKAYYEWMPIREPKDSPFASYRSFDFGDLASLIMLETRLTARVHELDYSKDLPTVDGKPDVAGFKAKWFDPKRRLMGPAQEDWFGKELARSVKAGHAWQVIGNQVVMARVAGPDLKAQMSDAEWGAFLAELPEEYRKPVAQLGGLGRMGLPYNLDAWDGYPAARERVYAAFKAAKASPIVLAGDSHAFWANELFDMEGTQVAVEMGATGITSPGAGDVIRHPALDSGFEQNKEVLYSNQSAKGFVLLTLGRKEAKGEMIAVSTIVEKTYETKVLKTWRIKPGANPLELVS